MIDFLSIALAGFASPLPPERMTDLRCVAVLAIVASEQERRTAAALELPPLAHRGARFAQIVGEGIVKETGRTQQQVRGLILGQVSGLQKASGRDAALPIAEAKTCLTRLDMVVPPTPNPSAAQCAGLLKLAADESKQRDGMSKATMDLIMLASLLDAHARSDLAGAGRSDTESDRDLTLSREALAAHPDTAPEIDDCMELARP